MKLILNLTQIEDVVKVRFELGKKFVRGKIYVFWQFIFLVQLQGWIGWC